MRCITANQNLKLNCKNQRKQKPHYCTNFANWISDEGSKRTCDPEGGQNSCKTDAGRALDVVVEAQYFCPVLLQNFEGVRVAEVLELCRNEQRSGDNHHHSTSATKVRSAFSKLQLSSISSGLQWFKKGLQFMNLQLIQYVQRFICLAFEE